MGNIYGAASAGGTYNYGEAFKLVPRKGGWQFSTVYQFNGQAEGGIPCCLVWDANGSLFGVNTYGGNHSYFGNIFELSPAADGTWNERVLYQFGGFLVQPNSLTLSSTGILYVTAREGGDVSCFFGFGCGGVLGLLQDSKQTLDFAFTGARQGELPWGAGIVFDSAGNLYGTTSVGGAYDLGVIYEITP
jgi:uncharacterized repeat protein (TIGR03803 family)